MAFLRVHDTFVLMSARRLPVPPGGKFTSIVLCPPIVLPGISAVGLAQLGPNFVHPEHQHDHHELHYVRCGKSIGVFGRREFSLKRGDIYFFRPGEPHGGGGRMDPRDPPQVFYLQIVLPGFLSQPFKSMPQGMPLFFEDPAPQLRVALRNAADELAAFPQGAHEWEELGMKALPLLSSLLSVLAALLKPMQRLAQTGTQRERDLTENVLRELELSRGAPPSLMALARKLNVSATYLGRALSISSGRTYPETVAKWRVEKAQQLLADENLPVRMIATRLGLSGPRALARLFRRVTGKRPSDYRP